MHQYVKNKNLNRFTVILFSLGSSSGSASFLLSMAWNRFPILNGLVFTWLKILFFLSHLVSNYHFSVQLFSKLFYPFLLVACVTQDICESDCKEILNLIWEIILVLEMKRLFFAKKQMEKNMLKQ